jgi:predicted aspartyl protease
MRLLVWSLAAAFATMATAPAYASCQIENITEIPVDFANSRLLAKGVIDGHAVRVLLDTGANMSLIWRPAAERLGLRLVTGAKGARMYGLGGESRVDGAFVGELRVASLTLKDLRLPVAGDLPSGLDFILAEDYLSRTSVEFDLQHHAVRTLDTVGCTTEQLPYWARTYSMADLIASPRDALAIRVDVLINGHVVRAQIDSGASLSVVSKSMADRIGAHYVSTGVELAGIGRGSLEMWIADVQTFTLGDETIHNTQLRVAQLGKLGTTQRIGSRIPVAAVSGPDMLLGLDFLRAHRVLIDNTTRKMVFTYEGGPVFQINNPAESGSSGVAQPPHDATHP